MITQNMFDTRTKTPYDPNDEDYGSVNPISDSTREKLRKRRVAVDDLTVSPNQDIVSEDLYFREQKLSDNLLNILFPEGRYNEGILRLFAQPKLFLQAIPNQEILIELQNANREGLEQYLPKHLVKAIYSVTPEDKKLMDLSLMVYDALFQGDVLFAKERFYLSVEEMRKKGAKKILSPSLLNKFKDVDPYKLSEFLPPVVVQLIYSDLGIQYSLQQKPIMGSDRSIAKDLEYRIEVLKKISQHSEIYEDGRVRHHFFKNDTIEKAKGPFRTPDNSKNKKVIDKQTIRTDFDKSFPLYQPSDKILWILFYHCLPNK